MHRSIKQFCQGLNVLRVNSPGYGFTPAQLNLPQDYSLHKKKTNQYQIWIISAADLLTAQQLSMEGQD